MAAAEHPGRGALEAVGVEQMTRCIRLPAARGSITDRHDAPLAVNAADVGGGVDRVLVVPALLHDRPADVDRLADADRAGRTRSCSRSDRRGGAPRCRCRWPRSRATWRTRSPPPRSPASWWSPTPVAPTPRARCSARSWASPGVATPEDEQRWPGLPPDEVVGRAGLEQQYDAVLRGIERAAVPVRRPDRRAGRAGRAHGPGARCRPAAVPRPGPPAAAGRRLAAAVRAQPRPRGKVGAAVAMDPRSGQVLAIVSTPSFDNNVYGPPVDGGALQAAGRRARFADARARDPGGRAPRVDVQAGGRGGQPGAPGLRAAPGRAHRGRVRLRRPRLPQLEADGPDEPRAVDRHLQRRLLLQARPRARARTT